MKTIYFVRHAKSSWKDPSLSDLDRPLNKRGIRNAPGMATYLSSRIEAPQIFVSSPSKRTLDTAHCFLDAFGLPHASLAIQEELYHGEGSDFEEVIREWKDQHETAMLFLHNPGITDYVNELTGSAIDNIPTCGVAAVRMDTDNWTKISQCPAQLMFFYYPKGLDLPSFK